MSILFKTIKKVLDPLWETPVFYKLLQTVLAGEGHKIIKNYLKAEIPKNAKKILDQGCGTGEYSLLFGNRYTGLDNNKKYIKDARQKYPGKFIVGNATKMKLKNSSFDICFSIGLHHHLSNHLAENAIKEALRITRKGGKIIIVDAMLPKYPLNIIGYFLRKIDRGGYVRDWKDTVNLLPQGVKFSSSILSSFPFDYVIIAVQKS